MRTPWGDSQTVHQVAEGILWVTTASHGGIHLSPQRAKDLAAIIPTATPFTGDLQWLEEDCDWAYAALAFPVAFPRQETFGAVRTARDPHTGIKVPDDYWTTSTGIMALAAHDAYAATVAGMWERGSCWCGGRSLEGWGVSMRRDGEYINVNMPDYPRKQFYTDAELAAFPRLA